jgi:glycosyltransferase involved in cell wall biosynthesis
MNMRTTGDAAIEANEPRIRVLLVAASLDILGGQSVQADLLVSRWEDDPRVSVNFLPVNPRLPGPLRVLQRIKYLRTAVTWPWYVVSLIWHVPRYDVLHVFSASYLSFLLAPAPAVLVGRLFRKKVILNYHSGEAEDHLRRWPRTAIPILRRSDVLVVPSEYLVETLRKFGLGAMAIANVVETERFAFRPRRTLHPWFLSSRNLEPMYNVAGVLRAFAAIQAAVPDATLTIVGDGSERDVLERMTADLQLRSVRFLGRVPQLSMPAIYDGSDIFLNASEIDNMPLSILEAFSAGLPVVTTDAGGIPYLVKDGETGLLVKMGDDAALAARAVRLLAEPELAEAIAARARAACSEYAWESVRGDWLALYESLAHPGRRTTRSPRRLRVPSVDEIGVRSRQLLAARAERVFAGRFAALPTDADIRIGPGAHAPAVRDFLAGAKPDIVSALAGRLGAPEKTALITAADRIVAGRFELLGHGDLSFGHPVDFHLDPVVGRRAPQVHWSRIAYLDPAVSGDHKVIWELNRHQWFVTLGRAWWLTRDEKYARCFADNLAAWMDQNPPKRGINWASSLEVAIRSIAWIWALWLFRDYPGLSPDLQTRARKFLYVHGRHIETYLSAYFSPNTHLTGEALGLVYLGTAFPEFDRATRWRKRGIRIMLDMLGRHVRPDGVYFEQSSYYHRYTTDFYTHLYLLTRETDHAVAEAVRPRLLALLDHLQAIQGPDGTTPFFGDDDGGRLLVLDERPANDFRAALSTGAVLFGRPDYKSTAGELAQETIWLLGPSAVAASDALAPAEPSHTSRAFLDGGYFVMRDGWGRDAGYLLIDCGPHGSLSCGHSHADALAIEVAAGGRPALVDPGTYTYTGSRELRDRFRSTPAHNTVTVDGQSSSEPGGPFSWQHIAECTARNWISHPRFDFFDGSHDGYARLPDPVIHRRSILFIKGDYWVMRDVLLAAGRHRYDVRFHFPAGTSPEVVAVGGLEVLRWLVDATRLDIWAPGAAGAWEIRDDCVSPSYGRREQAAVATLSLDGRGQTDILTVLVAGDDGGRAPRWAARTLQEAGGRCLVVEGPDAIDLVLIGAGSVSAPVSGRSDFEWTWMRLNCTGNRMLEFVGIAGRSFDLVGSFGVRADRRVDWLTATRRGNELLIDFEPALSVEVTVAEDIRRLAVNGRWTDTTDDEARPLMIRVLRPESQDTDVRH